MNWIKRLYLSIILKKHIVRIAVLWANDWYVMSVMDDGSGRNDTYWEFRKPSQENAISELVNRLMEIKYDKKKKIVVKEYKEKISEILKRIL